ncbi:MAG: MOSC domain-containing protein [Pseudomonadota bacterium]
MAFDSIKGTLADLEGVFAGHPKKLWDGKPLSSIQKDRLDVCVSVSFEGIGGDSQADLKLHGGPDKAVSFYPSEHYPVWNREIGVTNKVFSPGSFGENISSGIYTEKNVCIGDIFRLGHCELQVTQGRTPCWKLNKHTGVEKMAEFFLKTGRTGWYFRVLKEGDFLIDSKLELIDRKHESYTVYEITMARVSLFNSPKRYMEISRIPELSDGWKKSFSRKAAQVEQDSPTIAWKEPNSTNEPDSTHSRC